MAHRHSVLPRTAGGDARPPGLWIVDAETTQAIQVQGGGTPFVIPAGRTVESLMEAVSQSLDTAVAALRQISGGRIGRYGAVSLDGLDGVVALLQQARGMNEAAYETLVEAAIAMGQQ